MEHTTPAIAVAGPRRRRARRRAVVVGASLGALVVVAPAVVLAATSFPDVPADHPNHDDIAWMADTGISTGYADGTFRPAAPLTRQAMAAFLHRAWDLQNGADTFTTSGPFSDYGHSSSTFINVSAGLFEPDPLVVEIPPGTTGSIEVNVSGNAGCYDLDTGIGGDMCELRITIDGASEYAGWRTAKIPSGPAVQPVTAVFATAASAPLPPGTYQVHLQSRVMELDFATDSTIALDSTLLTAEVHLR